jgi:hypothetical protein
VWVKLATDYQPRHLAAAAALVVALACSDWLDRSLQTIGGDASEAKLQSGAPGLPSGNGSWIMRAKRFWRSRRRQVTGEGRERGDRGIASGVRAAD